MRLIGSFQKDHIRFTESPINEVWSRVAQFGSEEYLRKRFPPDNAEIDWLQYTSYISVRAQQAIELWGAYKQSTLLTSPISLYYSFLNIHRAFLALIQEVMPRSGHGLAFDQTGSLFSSGAKLTKGSFTDWLDASGIAWRAGSTITLEQCIRSCPELIDDVPEYFGGASFVDKVVIQGFRNKNTRIRFLNTTENFQTRWKKDYPDIANVSTLVEGEAATLELTDEHSRAYDKISDWASDHLEPRLSHSMNSIWYSYRKTEKPLDLPRSSYYYIGIFILSSVSRYQPELLIDVSSKSCLHNWIVNRFIQHAERYYPQMKLMESIVGGQVYFC